MSETIRIRTTPNGKDNYVKLKIDQEFDFIEVLSLKISQEDAYRNFCSDYGVVVGRVIVNTGFGLPNAKVSIFIPIDEDDKNNSVIKGLYPYEIITDKNSDGIRYNLLPRKSENNDPCFTPVGTFPNKREVLDNPDLEYIYCKYYKFTTTTNNAGDFMLFGVPLGNHTIHVDADLSDIGILSQKPYDLIAQGTPIKYFESSTKFKADKNLDKLPQIKTTNYSVNVQPFWGDVDECQIGISRADIDMNYNIVTNAVFFGSIFGDDQKNSINKRCRPRKKLGEHCSLVTGSGDIDMIRKTVDGEIEQFSVGPDQKVDEDGTWAYLIPMNLDYVVTDEFGDLVPSDDPNKGVATRASVRFRVGMDNTGGEGRIRTRAKFLIPNNPQNTSEVDYSFNETTKDSSFRDLFWNKIYSVTSFIPRYQANRIDNIRAFTGIKNVDECSGDKTPFPFNRVDNNLHPLFFIVCQYINIQALLIFILNSVIINLINSLVLIVRLIIEAINLITGAFCSLSQWRLNLSITILGETYNIVDITPFAWLSFFCKLKINLPDFIPCIAIECPLGEAEFKKSYAPGCYKYLVAKITNPAFDRLVELNKTPDCYPGDSYGHSTLDIAAGLDDCVAFSVAKAFNMFNLDFFNDWINGTLYGVLLKYKKKKRKREVFCEYECSGGNFNPINGVDGNKNGKPDNTCRKNFIIDRNFNSERNTSDNGSLSAGIAYKSILDEGLIKKLDIFSNGKKVGEEFYYASTKHDTGYKLFATDIICLGAMTDCDWQGVPNIHNSLIPTTYKIPPDIFEPEDDGKVSVTGMVGEDGNTAGLFFEISCLGLRSNYKQVLNIRHICEFGVDLDEIRFIDNPNGTVTTIYPNASIGSDDIDETYGKFFRDVFYYLNKDIPLKSNSFDYTKLPFSTEFDVNNNGVYPIATVNGTGGRGVNGADYVQFRGYPHNGDNDFSQPKHSYFFYFGLLDGKGSLEKLNQRFFTKCYPSIVKEFNILASSKSATLANPTTGSLTFTVTSGNQPFNYIISGPNGYNKTGTVQIDNTGNPIPLTINASIGIYKIEVTDANGNVVNTTINIDGPPSLYLNASVTKNCTTANTPDGVITINDFGGGSGTYIYTLYKSDGTTIVRGPVSMPTSSSALITIDNLPSYTESDIPPITTPPTPPSFGYILEINDGLSSVIVKGLKVDGPTLLEITESTINPITPTNCWDGENGSFEFKVSGGKGPYTITTSGPPSFNNGQTLNSLKSTGATRGNYTITVVDLYGTSQVKTFSVTSKNPEMVIAKGNAIDLAKQCDPTKYIIPFNVTKGAPIQQNIQLPTSFICEYNVNDVIANGGYVFTQENAIYKNINGECYLELNKINNLSSLKLRFLSSDSLCYSNIININSSEIRLPNTTLSLDFSNPSNTKQCNPNIIDFSFNISHLTAIKLSDADNERYPYTFSYSINGVQQQIITINKNSSLITLSNSVKVSTNITPPTTTSDRYNAVINYTITDNKGCSNTGNHTIIMPTQALTATWNYIPAVKDSNGNTITPEKKVLTVTGGLSPYTVSTSAIAINTTSDRYPIASGTITDSVNCSIQTTST